MQKNIISILEKKSKESLSNSLFVKAYLSMFIPYPSAKIITLNDVSREKIEKIISRLDLGKLKSFKIN